MNKTASAVTLAMATLSFSATMFGQQARRIAIYSFDDINNSRQDQVGQKLYDRLLSKLTGSDDYQVYDRQFLERIMKEQGLSPAAFDSSTAVRIGKLANVSAIVNGTISTYTINPKSSEDSVGVYGTVTVAATARLTSTETGAILIAPSVSQTARGLLFMKPVPQPQRTCTNIPFRGMVCNTPPAPSTPNVETKTTAQLLDEAIAGCAAALAGALAEASARVPMSSARDLPAPPRTDTGLDRTPQTNPSQVTGINMGRPASPGPVYNVGSGVTAPAVTRKVDPSYTFEALQAKLSGTVTLNLIVDVDGRASDIQVVKGLGMGLDEKAVEAVKQWLFNPGMRDGVPVRIRATIQVTFTLG